MSKFPSTFAQDTQALPVNLLSPAGKQALESIEQKGFTVHAGLTPEYAEAIITMALEPAIKEFCPNDSGSRFSNFESIKQWLTKERGVFLLLKQADDGLRLAGYGWVGLGSIEQVPGGETTFAIRIGELGQGQGLATPFTACMVKASAALYEAKNMWLETWESNGAAVHVYHKVGFEDVASEPSARPTADGGNVADTRLYMSLPNERLND